jgi:broad specificity phosphatase PhoE
VTTTTTNTIYLVRHGENPANIRHEFSYKAVDYSLTAKGRLQAAQTANFFRNIQIDEVYSSPLKRAFETGSAIAEPHHLTVNILEYFREINIGNLEGRPPTEENWDIHNRIVEDWLAGNVEESFPDGENYLTLLARMRDGLRTVTQGKEGKVIVIAGHGGIFTRTIHDICPTVDMQMIANIENHNCSISELEVQTSCDGRVTGIVKSWASIAHLHGEAAQVVPGTTLRTNVEVKEI